MKTVLYITLLLLIACSAFADLDSIVVNIYPFPDGDSYIGFPRRQIAYQDGRDTIAVVGQGSNALQRSVDGGATWSNAGGIGISGDYHAHVFILDDTLYITNRYTSFSDSTALSRADGNGALTLIDRINIGHGLDCNYTSATASAVKVGDKIYNTIRGGDCNLRYAVTDDYFVTQTDGYVENYSVILGATNTRQGLLIGNNGLPLMSAWLDYGSVDSIVFYEVDTATNVWTKYPGGLAHAELDRFYTTQTFDDSGLMVVTCDIDTKDTLFYSWFNDQDSTWTSGTVFERTASGGSFETMPGLVRIDSIGLMGLFYVYTGNLYFRYWKDNYSWSDEYTLIGGDTTLITVFANAFPNETPVSHGPVTSCIARNSSGDTYFIKLTAYESSGDATPPDSITDVYIRKAAILEGKI